MPDAVIAPNTTRWQRLAPLRLPAAVALGAFVLYVATLEPSVFWLDSGLYVAAAADFGIPYPPGFPLWVLLAQPFVWLSMLSEPVHIGWWVNLLSAVCGAAAAGLTAHAVQQLAGPNAGRFGRFAAVLAGAAVAVSASLWAQSVNAEVYSLAAALAAGFVCIAIRLDAEGPSRRLLVALAAVYGLSFGGHPLTVAFLPTFLLLLARAWGVHRRAVLTAAAVFLASGLLLYVWIPIRSSMRGESAPSMDWGNPETATNFVRLVTASHWTGEGQNFSWFGPGFRHRAGEAWALAGAQFGWVGLVLAAWGLAILWRQQRGLVRVLLPSALLLFLIPTAYVKTKEFEPWYIPLWGMTAVCIGVAVARGLGRLIDRARAAGLRTVAAALLVLWIPVWMLAANGSWLDRSARWEARIYAGNLLRHVEPNAIVFLSGDNPSSLALALQVGEGLYPGVLLINQESLTSAWVRENLMERCPEIRLSPPSAFYSDEIRAAVASGTLTAEAAGRTVPFGEWAREIVSAQIKTRPIYFLVPGQVRLRDSYFLTPRGMLVRAEREYQAPAASWFDLNFAPPGHAAQVEPAATFVPDLQYKYNEAQREAATGALRAYVAGAAALIRDGQHDAAERLLERAARTLGELRAWGRVPYPHPDGRETPPSVMAARTPSAGSPPAEPSAASWGFIGWAPEVPLALLVLNEWAEAEGGRVRPPRNSALPAALARLIREGRLAPIPPVALGETADRLMAAQPGMDDLDRRARIVEGLAELSPASPLVAFHRSTVASERAMAAGPETPEGTRHANEAVALLQRAAQGFDIEAQAAPGQFAPAFRRAATYARLFILSGDAMAGQRARLMLSELLKFPESAGHEARIRAMMRDVAARQSEPR